MRAILGICCALAGTAATAQALVTIDFLEKNSNAAVVYVPLGGATYDITVRLTSDEQTGGVSTAAMYLAASSPGFITVTGAVGDQGPTGTGTRYNSPSWHFHPDADAFPVSLVAGPLGIDKKGPYGSSIAQLNASFATSDLGWINVTLAPQAYGQSVTLSPIDVLIADRSGFELFNKQVNSATFMYVPEPSACLLLTGLFAMVRRTSRSRLSVLAKRLCDGRVQR